MSDEETRRWAEEVGAVKEALSGLVAQHKVSVVVGALSELMWACSQDGRGDCELQRAHSRLAGIANRLHRNGK